MLDNPIANNKSLKFKWNINFFRLHPCHSGRSLFYCPLVICYNSCKSLSQIKTGADLQDNKSALERVFT